jgi:hypothetical protein
MKKWLTAADTRLEITEGLREWFEQADNVLETAPAEDTDEDDTDDEDSATDSHYNSVDAEQDAQEDDDDEGQPHQKPKYLIPMNGPISFEDISTRLGLRAKKSIIGD